MTASLGDRLDAAMHLAIEQSNQVKGNTYPPVGAVVLDGRGEVVGDAEILALRRAGDLAAGGTVVVTLEPCNHHGKTPPCVDALLEAGVGTVVYAVADPNPQGPTRCPAARCGSGTGLPHLTWKYASSVDGRSAAADGSSRWISSEASRLDLHRRRAAADAIVVGTGR